MANIVETFKKRVLERLEILDLSQKELADRLKEAPASVSQYIGPSASKAPGIEKLANYARALECEPEELIREDEDEVSQTVVVRKALELLQDPERLAIISLILSLDKNKLGTVRDVVSRYGGRSQKKKPSAAV